MSTYETENLAQLAETAKRFLETAQVNSSYVRTYPLVLQAKE